jgi:hypothetical protein
VTACFPTTLAVAWSAAALVHLAFEASYRKPAPEETTVFMGRFAGTLYAAFEATVL